jgi:lipoprotein Spr
MSTLGERIAARARALVGLRFRPQGREPDHGLDCIGTAAAAMDVDPARIRRDYPLRGEHLGVIERELAALGCLPVLGGAARGDVLVCRSAPAQYHLLVCIGDAFVHADAGLRRIVERPMPAPWPIASVWRLQEEEG